MNEPQRPNDQDEAPLKPGMEWTPKVEVNFDRLSDIEWSGGYCEDVVYDALAYYKPYTINSNKWGIYYVIPNIEKDLTKLVSTLNNSNVDEHDIVSTVLIYPSLVTIHEICHHSLENVRKIKGMGNIYERDDEGLCEYTAFKLIEDSEITYPLLTSILAMYKPLTPMLIFTSILAMHPPPLEVIDLHHHGDHIHVTTRFGSYTIRVPEIWMQEGLWQDLIQIPERIFYRSLADLRKLDVGKDLNIGRTLAILYRWWGRGRDKLYRPKVSNKYDVNFLRNYWLQLRGDLVPYMDHALSNKPVKESLWTRFNVDHNQVTIRANCYERQHS